MRLFRLTRGTAHVGVYIGPWYLGMAGSPWLWLRPHLWPAFFRGDAVGGTAIYRIGPFTLTRWGK
jgi:hypothetical protein